jgi:hypothetical protein
MRQCASLTVRTLQSCQTDTEIHFKKNWCTAGVHWLPDAQYTSPLQLAVSAVLSVERVANRLWNIVLIKHITNGLQVDQCYCP